MQNFESLINLQFVDLRIKLLSFNFKNHLRPTKVFNGDVLPNKYLGSDHKSVANLMNVI